MTENTAPPLAEPPWNEYRDLTVPVFTASEKTVPKAALPTDSVVP